LDKLDLSTMKVLLFILVSILSVLGYFWFQKKRLRYKQYKEFLNVFRNEQINLPTLKFGFVYAWPTFEVTFLNKDDYEFAKQNRLLDNFKIRIKKFYDAEFNPDMAVHYKYLGTKL
jgi:hypothetical protein